MGKSELLKIRKRAQVDGWRIGVESTCTLIGAAIWNIRSDLELSDDQSRHIVAAIEPEIQNLLSSCNSSNTEELLEQVEYITNKSEEMKRRVTNNEGGNT